jgi:hypothetical protein
VLKSASVALLCVFVSGCLVTSAVEFEEEANVPPVVLDSAEFPFGEVIEFDRRVPQDLRVGVRVRDENLDDELEIRARVSVEGNDPSRTFLICQADRFRYPNGTPIRDALDLVLNQTQIMPGVCSQLEVFVSSRFLRECEDTDERFFDQPQDREDIARAAYLIWEMSGDPRTNPTSSQAIVNSCETRAQQPNITTTVP